MNYFPLRNSFRNYAGDRPAAFNGLSPHKAFPSKVKDNDNNNSIINIIVDFALPLINFALLTFSCCHGLWPSSTLPSLHVWRLFSCAASSFSSSLAPPPLCCRCLPIPAL
jgi:hypothetical protein